MAAMAEHIFCEGSMQKKEAKGKWITYYCVLRGDRLWCFSNRDTNNPSSLVGSIKMTTSTQLKKHKTKDGNYQFKIRNDRGEYRFRCSFGNDRDRWLIEIGKCARGDIPLNTMQQQPPMQQQPLMQQQSALSNPRIPNGPSPVSTPARPPMDVPSPPRVDPNNMLPGQRIALEEQMRRGTSFHGIPSSQQLAPGAGPGGSHFVRGTGSSASTRSVMRTQSGGSPTTSLMDSEYGNQEWFYGRIPRDIAEDYIMSYGVSGSFLLRESESSPGSYSLSFKSEHNDVRHYKIVRTGQRYALTGLDEKSFPNIIQVVQYYVEVNEGWATPLRRTDTGYQKHPALRDDAYVDRSFTPGFDLPGQGGPPQQQWSGAGAPMDYRYPGQAPPMGGGMHMGGGDMGPPQPSWQQHGGGYNGGVSPGVPPPPLMAPPPFADSSASFNDPPPPMGYGGYGGDFADLPPPSPPPPGMMGDFPPPPPLEPPPF